MTSNTFIELSKYNASAKRLDQALQQIAGTSGNLMNGYRFLDSCFSRRECPPINYDIYGPSFSYSYFLENYWKAVFAFVQDPPIIAKNLLDIGSGSGASCFAYLAWLDSHLGQNTWTIRVSFVDRSLVQLQWAEGLLKACSFKNIRVIPNFIHEDFDAWKQTESNFDIVMLGHVLNENLGGIAAILSKAQIATAPNGKLYIIERSDDNVTWQKIRDIASALALTSEPSNIEVKISQLTMGSSPRSVGRDVLLTKYLCILMPANKNLYSLVRCYFQAWAERSADDLAQIFTSDAEYCEKPFAPPYKGINEIIRYWKEKVLPQKDVRIDIYKTIYSGNVAIVMWQAQFQLPDGKTKQVRGVMSLYYDPSSNKISRLEEYFRTSSVYTLDLTARPDALDSPQEIMISERG